MQQKKKKPLSDAHIEEAAHLFRILSEPSRLRLLRALMDRAMTVSELMDATGLKQGNVSKHLAVLLTARLVGREREGNFARYAITDKKLFELCNLVCSRMETDARRRLAAFAA